MIFGDFYEDDEPAEDVVANVEAGEKAAKPRALGWFCTHMAITSSAYMGLPAVGCGCQMQPLVTTGH